jgi:hypothetical protein
VSLSPTQLSLRAYRELGYVAEVVERWVSQPAPGHRKDLFGFVDVLAVGNGLTVAVQCTSDANVASRIRKIADEEALPNLREAGWIVVVHGWKKQGGRWVVREVNVS